MAATEADAAVAAAIDASRRLPENVFRGDWHAYYFFDPDRLLQVPEAIYAVHALLEGEDAACAVLRQISERIDPGNGMLRVVIDRSVPPKPARTFLQTPDAPPTRFLESFGLASDRGGWAIYLEGEAELGVLAIRDEGLRAALDPARRLLNGYYIEHIEMLRGDIHPKFLEALREGYGWGTSAANWGKASKGSTLRPPVPAGATLAPRTADHARVLYPLLHGTTVCDTLVWDGPESLESFVATYACPPGMESHRHFTIMANGQPVGSLSIRPGFQPQRGDIGYWVGIPYKGKGYATAAVREALRIGFRDMGMGKIEACAFVGNQASRRVLEKNGFVQEGATRKAVLKRGHWLDEWVFGITREEWKVGIPR